MPEPQKRHISRRGLKRSLNKQKQGLRFKGWRAVKRGRRLGKTSSKFNAWHAHRRKQRIGL